MSLLKHGATFHPLQSQSDWNERKHFSIFRRSKKAIETLNELVSVLWFKHFHSMSLLQGNSVTSPKGICREVSPLPLWAWGMDTGAKINGFDAAVFHSGQGQGSAQVSSHRYHEVPASLCFWDLSIITTALYNFLCFFIGIKYTIEPSLLPL